MEPIIKPLDTDSEIRRKTEEILGDAGEKTVKTFIQLLENFKDADSEDTYHLVGVAQKYAFSKTETFERSLSEFAGLPKADTEYSSNRYLTEIGREQ